MKFDANTFFGALTHKNIDYSLEALLKALKDAGIERALTYSLRGVTYDYSEGNDETLDASRKYPQLIPVATIDPRRYIGCVEEVDKRADQGFKIVRFFPELQGWSVEGALFEKILARMGERNLAAMFSMGPSGNASRLMRMARPYGVPIILADVSYGGLSEAVAVARSYDRTYIESNKLNTPDAVEFIASEVGPERILFGSRSPECYPSAAEDVISWARVPSSVREKIKGANLASLLETLGSPSSGQKIEVIERFISRDGLEVEVTGDGPRPVPEEATERPPFEYGIVDVHCHFGKWPFPILSSGAEGILEIMGRFGITCAVLSSSLAIVYDFRAGNRRLQEAIACHPELSGYVPVNPNFLEESRQELESYFALPNFVGAKIHPVYSRQSIGSPAMAALFEVIASYRRPLLIHTWGEGEVRSLYELARKHPGLPILMGHMGGDSWQEAIEVARKAPNIYVEFCCSYPQRPKVEKAVERVGPDRVLFGSDLDLINPGFILGMVRDARLSDEEKEKLLHENAEALFVPRRPVPRSPGQG